MVLIYRRFIAFSTCCFRFIIVALFLFFMLTRAVFATVNNFNHLTIRDGLSQSTVNAIFQDKSGFLWIGTVDGLNRYDGYTFTKYLTSRSKANSLLYPQITSITEDHLGHLWVGTSEGVTILEPDKEEFKRISSSEGNNKVQQKCVNVLFKDISNCMWVGGTSGIGKFQYLTSKNKADSLVQVSLAMGENSILTENIVGVGANNAESLWILTADSLGIVANNGESKELPLGLCFPPNGTTATCILWSDSSIYLGCKNGLFYFDLKNPSGAWQEKLFEGKSFEKLSFIKKDLEGNIWVGTSADGVYVYDLISSSIRNYRHNVLIERSLNNNNTNSMAVTRSGLVVIGTDLGINLYDKRQGLFNILPISPQKNQPIENIHGLIEDDKGNIWIGTKGGGVFVYSPDGKLLLNLNKNKHSKGVLANNIRCVAQDKEGTFWIGTESMGVYKIIFRGENYSNPEVAHYKHSNTNAFSIPSNKIYAIYEDFNGNLWFGSNMGLSCLVPSEKNKLPQKTRFITLQHDPENPKSIAGNSVYSIYRDRLGVFWVGSINGGLSKMLDTSFLEKQNRFEKPIVSSIFRNYKKSLNDLSSLAGYNIYSIYEDKHLGNLWIGTNEGLCRFNREKDNFKVYTTDNGLTSNTVYGILEDENGCLWLSTNQGLSKYDQRKDVFYNYGEGSGLQYPEFNGNSYLKTSKGVFLFGGAKGINSFHPEQIRPSIFKAPIFITGLKIKNQKILPNDGSKIFNRPIHQTSKIVLGYDQNFITFYFSLLNYLNPEQNRFAYKLEGYQQDWTYTTGDNSATFTGLPPGTYTFLLKGSDGYSLWDTETKEMIVVIKPLIWFTWWAKWVYALVVATIISLFVYGFKKRARLKHAIDIQRMSAKKNQEIYEEKLDFFTNVSHEFLTPLTLIIGPIHDLILEQKDPTISKRMKLINRSANRLKNLIDQLLSLRKLDNGQTTISVAKADIELFARKVASGFNGLAARRNIKYEFDVNERLPSIWFDHDAVEKIVYNLLSNAFKHTSEKGKIVVSVSTAPGYGVSKIFDDAQLELEVFSDYVAIKVNDNGAGISTEDCLLIFDRYFQVDKQVDGAGIGLSFAQSLAHLHKGIITVKSKLGKGSLFTLFLPIGDCYNEMEKTELANKPVPSLNSFEYSSLPREAVLSNAKASVTVLVVEDNEEMRYYIADALHYEFNVVIARDGKEAITKLESLKIDLIISDIVMPTMDGLELLKTVRETPKYRYTPVILLSARIDAIQKIQGLELGIGAYISKPFEIPYLVAVAKRLLEQTLTVKKIPDNNTLDINISSEFESSDNKLMIQLKTCIEENYSDPNFNVVTLAEDIGLSRSQLHRRFKGLTGTTPSNFVKEIRMAEAVKLLEESDLAIFEICFAVGFSDPKYFSKEFRKKYGMTPSLYAEPFKK